MGLTILSFLIDTLHFTKENLFIDFPVCHVIIFIGKVLQAVHRTNVSLAIQYLQYLQYD